MGQMEEAFAWIERGNQALDATNNWQASHCYCQALRQLLSLSVSSSVTPDVADLCQAQSVEYKHKARECFVRALQQQQEVHALRNNDEVNQERLELFAHLYSDPKLLNKNTTTSTTTTALDDLSLRLQALHAFQIPNQSKTKIEALNAGLRRLGLQPVTSLDNTKNQYASTEWLHIDSNQTPDEQLDVLLRQVQEQIQIVGTKDQADKDAHNNKGDDDSSLDEETQVNQLLQQLQDEQALDGDEIGCNHDENSPLAKNVETDGSHDEDLTRQKEFEQIIPLSAKTAEKVMKDTLEAELLLTQVLALLEKDEEDELERSNNTNNEYADGIVVQKLLRQARSVLRRAEQNARRDDEKNKLI
jgi:hypothetical protein